jgi:hypothetical protein
MSKRTFRQGLIAHGASMFLEELLWRGLPVTFQVSKRLGLSKLSMGLKADFKLSAEIGNLE